MEPTSRQVRNAVPQELAGLQFYNQKESAQEEKNFFVFLQSMSCFYPQLFLQVEQRSFLIPT